MKNKKTGKYSFNVTNIPGGLLESFKKVCFRRHRTMRGTIIELMDEYIIENRSKVTAAVEPPPIVAAVLDDNENPFGETEMTPEEIAEAEKAATEFEAKQAPEPIEGEVF